MCGSVLNKVNELRRNPLMRNIFGQTKNAIDAQALIRERGILIVHLVAVGTGLATRPPRRSRRARFGHRAPISGE